MASKSSSFSARLYCALATSVALSFAMPLLARAGDQSPLRAFVTSITGNGDLSSWPGANGQTGLAAADAVCRDRAAEASLERPDAFVAWMSDSTTDAYCRIFGLAGTKADRCGQVELPTGAGPWLRTDGLPFAPVLGELMNPAGRVFYPLSVDEHGQEVSESRLLTATNGDGAVAISIFTCDDWSSGSTSALAIQGNSHGGKDAWTRSGDLIPNCIHADRRLACMETGIGPELDFEPVIGSRIFVTSSSGNGNLETWPDAGGLDGLAAADAICQAHADRAGLGNADQFRAWLNMFRLPFEIHLRLPLVRLDGVQVAKNAFDFNDGVLAASPNVDEFGRHRSGVHVWTGNFASRGGRTDCLQWTANDSLTFGTSGTPNIATRAVQFTGDSFCDQDRHLYCVEDIRLFSSDFEALQRRLVRDESPPQPHTSRSVQKSTAHRARPISAFKSIKPKTRSRYRK